MDLPDVGEKFYAIGTPMRGGFEGAMEDGKVAGYRYMDAGVDILTTTNVQSVTLGGILVDENGNAIGLAHAGESLTDSRRDGFIPIGDAFDAKSPAAEKISRQLHQISEIIVRKTYWTCQSFACFWAM